VIRLADARVRLEPAKEVVANPGSSPRYSGLSDGQGLLLTNRDNQRIAVAGATDAHYAMPLAVMLCSVGHNVGPGVAVDAYIVDDGVSATNRAKVDASLPPNVHLHWVDLQGGLEGLPTWGRMPLTTYRKLTVAEWTPPELDRVIWLDCDLLALDDISTLWGAELGNHLAAAVQDPRVALASSQFGVAAWRELGLPADAKYFNAGVMVIDLLLWREQGISQRALEYLRDYGDRVYFWDQEALNAVLAGRYAELDPRWNRHPSLEHVPRIKNGSDGPSGIVHFTGHLKPWNLSRESPSHRLYQSYLARTAWAGWTPANRWRDRVLGWYETSGVRRWLYPLERWFTVAERFLTKGRYR
jgi:lipopolysaccharide biosynthesis glycosyltransferase